MIFISNGAIAYNEADLLLYYWLFVVQLISLITLFTSEFELILPNFLVP